MTIRDTVSERAVEPAGVEPDEEKASEDETPEAKASKAEALDEEVSKAEAPEEKGSKAEASGEKSAEGEAPESETSEGKAPEGDAVRETTAKRRRRPRRWVLALAVVVGLAAGAGTSWATADRDGTRPADQERLRASVKGEITAALPMIFSYTADHVDATRQAADRTLTGVAAAQYRSLMEQVAVQAPQQHLDVSTRVTRAAVIELHHDTATLLVFLDQVSSRPGQKQGTAATALVISAKKSGTRWLISGMTSAMKEQP